jgi:hypothetical protein
MPEPVPQSVVAWGPSGVRLRHRNALLTKATDIQDRMTHRIAAARRTGQLDRSVWISANGAVTVAGHLADGWLRTLLAPL